ncbi:Nif3-like dinuclear metal center hexameric protein [Ruminococcaceae bacterium OttesenSCG-928-N02]|nr:Nif3-like dinuclear metal center hexameric protein [Ruminococcaceae bacterium OttesenSCG-928-N02]
MPKIAEIAAYVNSIAPFETAEPWDNSGVLVDCGSDVTAILVALDITEEVVVEAEMQGCQLIVAHHPVIFHPLTKVDRTNTSYRLVKKNISAICAHTNLDAANGGPSDVLAKLLELTEVQPFGGAGRIGLLRAPATVAELAALCKITLRAPVCYCEATHEVHKLAVVGGAGASLIKQAIALGAHCLLTGELSHHDALDAKQAGLSTIAAGHFETEFPAMSVLASKLARRFTDTRVILSRRGKSPFTYI